MGVAGAAAVASGCSEKPAPVDHGKPTTATTTDAGAVNVQAINPGQLPGERQNAGKPDAGPYDGPLIGAMFMQTPSMSDMEWPFPESATKRERDRDPVRSSVARIGYIRRGAKVPVIPEAHKKDNCKDGWYELVAGGFVCGKYATLDLNHPRVKIAPHLPFMNASLPYEYGYNVSNGTPLYRHAPSREERVALEPWLSAKARPKRGIEESNPYDLDAGVPTMPTLGNSASATIALATPNDPLALGAEVFDAGTPWYLRDYDGGKPTVTLDDLREAEGGPVVRRMVKGFYLALDEEFKDNHQVKYWKNTDGFLAPYERIFVNRQVSDFHGVWMKEVTPADLGVATPAAPGNPPMSDAGATPPVVSKIPTHLPMGFMLWRGKKFTMSDDKKQATAGEPVPRFTAVQLTGNAVTIGGFTYEETEEGWWMRTADGQVARAEKPPKDLAPNEKWIDVNLKTQTLVAYEGEKPVYATVVSTGKKLASRNPEDKDKDHRTKPGTFRIREKHIASTMDGDVATDGPYSIEDVPWIMYFNGSIALHGAFWHSNFGSTKSHGCVNLAPVDARAMFGWTDPPLPDGWHGVMSTPDRLGTRVIVHDPDCPKGDCTFDCPRGSATPGGCSKP
jgi:lipoprotein-anchoring transpeptidase ErfK/SrfK